MLKFSIQHTILAVLFSTITLCLTAQKVNEPTTTNADWSRPYQPFRIAGNLYYVGSYDLASYLIATTKGNILINTGLAASTSQIKKNIESLDFKFADTKILLTTQAHFDHMGAMAAIKKMTGAQFMVDKQEADVVESGGSSDYALGGHGSTFKPVRPDRLLSDGDTILLGDMQLVLLHHPGHTKGSCSFLFTVHDNENTYRILIANMPTIVTEKSFSALSSYPKVANDYAYTLAAMKNIQFDIWVASHASQFNMHEKHKPGDGYNPAAFEDKAGYDAEIKNLQKEYDEKMKKDAQH